MSLAFLNQGLKLQLKISGNKEKEVNIYYEGGIKSYVEYLNRSKEADS